MTSVLIAATVPAPLGRQEMMAGILITEAIVANPNLIIDEVRRGNHHIDIRDIEAERPKERLR